MKAPFLNHNDTLSEEVENFISFERTMKNRQNNSVDDKPMFTGRYFLIPIKEEARVSELKNKLKNSFSIEAATTSDFNYQLKDEELLGSAEGLIYDNLGIALVGTEEKEKISLLEKELSDYFLIPEEIAYVPDDITALANLKMTWGLQKIYASYSKYTGKDVKVAVLDTGFDINHPDFNGRTIVAESFTGETIDDGHGHGTHCIGTACGDTDRFGVRYGVAKGSKIYSGKVLSNKGSGAQAWIINAIEWATLEGCKVISMSLGSRILPGQGFNNAYERVSTFASNRGAVVIAASGNDSKRSRQVFSPVSSPANCPSILAVGAVTQSLTPADFSNRSINPDQNVDIVAPGVDVYSSWPTSKGRYQTISGTSMATPHVAGILALLWEKYPSHTPDQIVKELKTISSRLSEPVMDVGAGLAIAP